MRLLSIIAVIEAVLLVLACSAWAAEGDPSAGKRKTVTCNGCHGQAAMKNVPSLGGQSATYFVAAMVAYQDGVRTHATMRDVAKSWSLQDLKNFAAWYAEPLAPAGEAAAAPAAAERCTSCHGADGRDPVTPDVPRIAGQKANYLAQVLREYRDGTRVNAVMQPQVAELKDDEIAVLAGYFAGRAGLGMK
jgi:cytochrome c553